MEGLNQATAMGFGAIPGFALFLGIAVVQFIVFTILYTLITPKNEWKLIRENNNLTAAISLFGALIGYSLPLSSALSNSVSAFDFFFWANVAIIVQLIAHLIVRFGYLRNKLCKIEEDSISVGIVSAAFSISFGLLNAGCMSY